MLYYSKSLISFDYSHLEFPQVAPIVCFVFSAAICRGYNNLIDYSYELMILCFMADEEMFQGDQRFASAKVTEYFNKYGTESERAYLKNIESVAMEKRAAKDKTAKKKGKKNQVVPLGAKDGEENSSEEEMEEHDQAKVRNEYIKSMMERERKKKEEDLLKQEQRKAEAEAGIKKKKIDLAPDTVAGNLLKMVQRQAVNTTAKEDKIKLLEKKEEE